MINPVLTDPSLVFVIFIISLWVTITAAHVPGTGALEVVAFIGIIVSAIILFQMPTNWLAVLVMLIGWAGYSIMPFIKHDYFILAWGGIILQGIGGLFLFNGMMVSPFVVGIVMLILAGYCQFILLPALRLGFTRSNATKDDQLVGAIGRATTDIDQMGTALVQSEIWTVKSDSLIKKGESVVVIERDGLQLVVESLKRKRTEDALIEEETR
ncbi:MAG: NfeD family protein [bacterium]|nr:NfeD family protein [bacterium]